MANITENLSVGWYGTCDGCTTFNLYDEASAELITGMENVISITQIKEGGFVYTSWLKERDNEKRVSWESLPEVIKQAMNKLDWVKDGQGVTELECGAPYLIKITEGTSIEINGFYLAGLGHEDAGRVVECEDCPTYPNCICED